jgi:hypothetical protein
LGLISLANLTLLFLLLLPALVASSLSTTRWWFLLSLSLQVGQNRVPSLKGPSLAAGGVRGILQTGGEVLLAGSQLAQILTGWLALIFLQNLLLYLVLGRHLLLFIVPEPPS